MSLHRRAPRKDANHGACVNAFRALGCLVQVVSETGAFDLVVGCGSRMRWVEIKDGERPKSQRKLTPEQVVFQQRWGAHAFVVESIGDVMRLVALWRAEK